MKISYQWLKKYVDLDDDLSLKQLAYDLTMRTVEVEGWEKIADRYRHIVVGKILKIEDHPRADRLKVLQLDLGMEEPRQIVCGGSNLFEGHWVVVTLPGAKAVWHGEGEAVEIQQTELRGVASYGMVAGAKEVGLEALFPPASDHQILDLTAFDDERIRAGEAGLYPGQPIADALGLDDQVIEIDNKSLTNRPDLWGHHGMARELAAIYKKELRPLPEADRRLLEELPAFPVDIQADDLCYRYMALEIEGVDTRPAPLWMQEDLMKCDVRPINALVDITNYVMLAVGNPTHAFDRNHVKDGILIRRAREGEELTLLDDSRLKLDPEKLVIATPGKAVALAGCMGGREDSIHEESQAVVFEIASFNRTNIRKTAQQLLIHTESSMRFEKGVDTQRADEALGLTVQLFKLIFPDCRFTAFTDAYPHPTRPERVEISMDWLSRRLGRPMDAALAASYLDRLGFRIQDSHRQNKKGEKLYEVEVPSWRSTGDVSLPDDILEEIARMIGYEYFEPQPLYYAMDHAINQKKPALYRRIREYLAHGCGFQEIFTYPWVKDTYIEAAGCEPEEMLSLTQPPAPDESRLRSSLVPGQLAAIVKNLRYFDHFAIFELAEVFKKGDYHPTDEEESLPDTRRQLAGAVVGNEPEELFFRLKGVLEGLGRNCQTDSLRFSQEEQPAWADRQGWASILYRDQVIGEFGLLSNAVKNQTGIKFHDAAVFSLYADALQPFESRQNSFTHLPKYPHVFQDLSLLVKEEMSWKEVQEAAAPYVAGLEFIDEYYGQQIPQGMKSITLRAELASEEGTLTNAEVMTQMGKIRDALAAIGAEVRQQ